MKRKNLILFIIITFLWSICIAALKFFLRSYLKEVNISVEEIAGYLSIGGIVAYLIGSSLAYAFRAKTIVLASGLIAIVCLIIGNICGYYPFRIFVLLVSSIGFAYSLRLVIKSIILSSEIQNSNGGEAKINGIVNIAILVGILLGSYLGFALFEKRGANGFLAITGLLLFSNILTIRMNYDKEFTSKRFATTLKQTIPNIRGITKKYVRLLVPIGVLRAISTALGLKMLEIGVNLFDKTPQSGIIIIVISFIGAIIGNVISIFFKKKRKLIAMIFTIIFGLSTIYFPHIINRFDFPITLNIFGFCIGIFFGIAVNLLEGRYFFHIGDDHRKEYGSVAYGIITSVFISFVMIASDYLSNTVGIKVSFFFFGIMLLLMPFFIKRFDASDISEGHSLKKQ